MRKCICSCGTTKEIKTHTEGTCVICKEDQDLLSGGDEKY